MLNGRDVADGVLAMVNSYANVEKREFVKAICSGHRTLQQSVMRLFVQLCERMSKNATDDRNQSAVELAKKITEIAKDYPLPLI